MERIAATMSELVKTPEVMSFSISRSRAPAAESKALGADAVVDLFRSEEPAEVQEVYAFLAERFEEHEKARAHRAASPLAPTHVFVALFAVADIEDPSAQ